MPKVSYTRSSSAVSRQKGFAYLFVLFLIALVAVSALAVTTVAHYSGVRSDERELLRIGAEFRRALQSYRSAVDPQVYPLSLDDLVSDERTGEEVRHLRRIYVDPITRTHEWGIVVAEGRIVGMHSLSSRVPLKTSGFLGPDGDFEGAETYADWVFHSAPLTQSGR